MNITEKIIAHLNQYDNYDIRDTKNGQFTNQKVTPDVLSTVADCVLNHVGQDIGKEFTRRDIQFSDYTTKNVSMIFSKPGTDNSTAAKEYDKFFGQPLQALAYSHILNAQMKKGAWHFTINNFELLEYISTKEFFAFNFLFHYLEKVLSESGFLRHIEKYKSAHLNGTLNRGAYNDLKERWGKFLSNTGIKSKKNQHRIFPKMLNIFAVKYQMPGSDGGDISTYPFTFNDLLYNRLNWRDTRKNKGLTRQESAGKQRPELAEEYRIQKALRIIREKYAQSELQDQWAKGKATCVHHIFPRSEFPKIAAYYENLIKLTVQQHMEKAHKNHNTKTIDESYQLDCLMAKSLSIESSLNLNEEIYTIEDFIYVINEGLKTDWPCEMVFDNIRSKLIEHWSMA